MSPIFSSSSSNNRFATHNSLSIHHPRKISQYTYNGPTSCTYCCLEASLYFLHGLIDSNMSSSDLHRVMEMVLSQGVLMDHLKDGYRAADEVLQRVPRFKHQLKLCSISHYKLTNEDCFSKLVQSLKKKCQKMNLTKMAVCITKPPETIALFYDSDNIQFPFCVFDSHSNGSNGASFRFCKENELKQYLRGRLKLMDITVFGGNTHIYQQYSMFEANFFTLGEIKQLMDPRAYSDYQVNNSNPMAQTMNSMASSALDYSLSASILPAMNGQQKQNVDYSAPSAPQSHNDENGTLSQQQQQQQQTTAPSSIPPHKNDNMDFISIIRTLVSERKTRNATIEELKEKNAKLEEEKNHAELQIKEKDEIIHHLEKGNELLIAENAEAQEFNNQLAEVVQVKEDRIRELTETLDSLQTLIPRMEEQKKQNVEMTQKYQTLLKEFSTLLSKGEE
uniref:Uncharacterized protein n=1 Tax=Percolomonas cosmopolitus TaxID=63605 RepID=A0A7S1KLU7_9EUKA|mmetsp:Transcript_10384/g.38531  ORF Transcript_10384/g.38531 Transcript_10384/m.38531 type:complete len:448 (+) Transcript_10384:212-1555(+)